jgi:hypothetical protein
MKYLRLSQLGFCPSRTILLAGAVCLAGLGVAFWLVGGGARAQEKKLEPAPGSAKADPLTEISVVRKVRSATSRALEYLRSKQRPNGSWHDNQAMNALALLAFLGRGHVPGRGPYREVLEKGKQYLINNARADGLLASAASQPMYQHGLCTLALAEMYGMDPDPELEKVLRKAVDLIVKCQCPRLPNGQEGGGWRYQPSPTDQDLSVTVMQIVALRAANNAEIPVPVKTIENAIKYVRYCGADTGGFGYTGPSAGPQTTAAGILSLQLLGKYDDPKIPKSLTYLTGIPIYWDKGNGGPQYFYYFHYYAVQAAYQAGGKHWEGWHPRIRELLLEHQNKDGSWDVPVGTSESGLISADNKVYSTAMACLVLDIYMHFLPAYQR